MANLKDMASRGTLLNFDPRKIKIQPGLNARDLATEDNEAHIAWLAASIAEEGVKVPLVIFQDGEEAFVADGHCRLTATLRAIAAGADIKTVPCIIEPRGTNDVDRVLSQNIYNSGKHLTPLEQGVNFKKAKALGASVVEIAKKVGLSPSYVNQMINLQAAPAEAHQLVKTGKVSATLAADVIREKGPSEGLKTLKTAVKSAETSGKSRATAKDIQPRDALWARLQKYINSQKHRPVNIADDDIYRVLEMLGEP